jgi:hypothetical protein
MFVYRALRYLRLMLVYGAARYLRLGNDDTARGSH